VQRSWTGDIEGIVVGHAHVGLAEGADLDEDGDAGGRHARDGGVGRPGRNQDELQTLAVVEPRPRSDPVSVAGPLGVDLEAGPAERAAKNMPVMAAATRSGPKYQTQRKTKGGRSTSAFGGASSTRRRPTDRA
jgi:hypothetical protein